MKSKRSFHEPGRRHARLRWKNGAERRRFLSRVYHNQSFMAPMRDSGIVEPLHEPEGRDIALRCPRRASAGGTLAPLNAAQTFRARGSAVPIFVGS
jgi:hypothetical protein